MLNGYEAIVIGVSSGGLGALTTIIPALPEDFSMAVIVVQHLKEDSDSFLPEYLDNRSSIPVKEAAEMEAVLPGAVYIAPAGYHLLVESEKTFSLSVDPRVNFARPSINVLFESAADVYEDQLVGVILTGANNDGSAGLRAVKSNGGLTVVQDPATAESAMMPQSALETTEVDHVLALGEMAPFFKKLQ